MSIFGYESHKKTLKLNNGYYNGWIICGLFADKMMNFLHVCMHKNIQYLLKLHNMHQV